MQKAKEEVEFSWEPTNWSDVKNLTINRLVERFRKHPYHFFTEHDIHSVLYSITREELKLSGTMTEETRDGYQAALLHHEYPTPFRCDMRRMRFQKKETKPYKRGHYDLVILNPEFVKNNSLDVVCAKDYQRFQVAMENVRVEPLIWACEVIFFPGIRNFPKNGEKMIEQDALKLKETLKHKPNRTHNFCRAGTVLVFTNHSRRDTKNLKRYITQLREKLELEIILSTTQR